MSEAGKWLTTLLNAVIHGRGGRRADSWSLEPLQVWMEPGRPRALSAALFPTGPRQRWVFPDFTPLRSTLGEEWGLNHSLRLAVQRWLQKCCHCSSPAARQTVSRVSYSKDAGCCGWTGPGRPRATPRQPSAWVPGPPGRRSVCCEAPDVLRGKSCRTAATKRGRFCSKQGKPHPCGVQHHRGKILPEWQTTTRMGFLPHRAKSK